MHLPKTQRLMPKALSVERDRLVLWLPVMVGCGIALFFAGDAPPSVLPAAIVGLVSLGLLWLLGGKLQWRWGLVAIVTICLGFIVAGVRLQLVHAPVLHDTVFFKSVTAIIADIEQQEGKTRLILRDVSVETLAAEDTPKNISISLRKPNLDVRIGDHIQIPATLFPPPTPAMPNAYDFSRMFYFKQRGAVGFSPRQPEIIAHAGAESFSDKLTTLRLSIADRLRAQMGSDESAVASAMMVGEQSQVSDEVSEDMRNAGIYHILSISGMHMSLACGIIFYVVRLGLTLFPTFALYLPVKKIAACAGLVGGFAYLLLAGYPVPAVRSYVMVACVLLAVLFDRKGISLFSLAWAASIILLFSPESLFTASFQLSFAATLAIVALYERYGHVMFNGEGGAFSRLRLYFMALMLTSLAASAFTTPLALYHFNRIALWGIFSNMLMVPLSSFIIMPAAVLAFLLMPFGAEGWILWLLNMGIRWMLDGAHWVAHLPLANVTFAAPSVAGYSAIIISGLWLGLWRSNIRFLGLPLIIVGLATSALYQPFDLIISDDAKRIAYRTTDNQWVLVRGDTDSFEAESWLRISGVESAIKRKKGQVLPPELRCDKSTCLIEREGLSIAMAVRKDKDVDICESGADIVISDYRLYKPSCDTIAHVIDRAYVNRHGAVGIRLQSWKITIENTNEYRGNWPWSAALPNNQTDNTPND